MLDKTRAVHAIDIRQCNRQMSLLIHPYVNESCPVIEPLPQDRARHKRDNVRELGLVGCAALRVEGIMLDQVHGDVVLERISDILFGVEARDESGEDGVLLSWGRRARRAVGRGELVRVVSSGVVGGRW